MHIPFLGLKFKSTYLLLEWLCSGISLACLAAVALDWNQIIMGVIGIISAYIALRARSTEKKVDAVSTDVGSVNKNLEATKHEMNSQMTEALRTAVAKGVLEGVDQERKRRELQDSDRAKGKEAGRKELLEKDCPTDEPKK